MGIVTAIVSFFIQALALKWALGLMGQPSRDNKYTTALTVSAILTVSWFALGFFPVVGWIVYAVLWFGMVMGIYKVGFARSLGVAVLQVGLRWGLKLLLVLIGFGGAA